MRSRPRLLILAWMWCAPWLSVGAAAAETPASPVAGELRSALDNANGTITAGASSLPALPVRAFYAERGYQPLWVDGHGLTGRGEALLQGLRSAGDLGLDPNAYAPALSLPAAGDPAPLAAAELAMTAAFLNYARDLQTGRLMPRQVDQEYAVTPPSFGAIGALNAVAAAPNVQAHLVSLAPTDPVYVGLIQGLKHYRALAAAGGWEAFPPGSKLQPGEVSDRVPVLRRILRRQGDDPGPEQDGPERDRKVYDPHLAQAVKRFQQRHGLEPDAVIGPQTAAALGVSAEDRVRQILINMERWRWLPRDLGDPHVLVNMAGFELQLVERGQPPLSMRVVVGQPVRRTPVFSDEISYLEFNPTWTVPSTIAVEDLLPKIRRDPGMLHAQGISVYARGAEGSYAVDPADVDWSTARKGAFPYRLRQDAGPRNPLGRVKFMFPNPYAIYLHDTPSRGLFQRSRRAFSSGCIRVEKPVELAERLLAGTPGWSRQRIDAAIDSGKTRSVSLAAPVPVHLVYLTAWQDGDGKMQFREDLYGRDTRLLEALFKNAA